MPSRLLEQCKSAPRNPRTKCSYEINAKDIFYSLTFNDNVLGIFMIFGLVFGLDFEHPLADGAGQFSEDEGRYNVADHE